MIIIYNEMTQTISLSKLIMLLQRIQQVTPDDKLSIDRNIWYYFLGELGYLLLPPSDEIPSDNDKVSLGICLNYFLSSPASSESYTEPL
jgi:hypothetical protein